MRIVITTPTGNIGRRVVSQLLDTPHSLTLIVRDASKLSEDIRARSTIVEGDLEDDDALDRAFTGADAAFLLVPPPASAVPVWRPWQEGVGRRLAAAAKRTNVARAVFLSSTGAQHPDVGPVSGLGVIEQAINDALANVVSIRAGSFMENFFGSLPTIASQGAIYGVSAPDTPYAVVATQDIGDVAVRWLTDATWSGHHVVGAHGPAALSPNDSARVLADVLGRPIQYVQIPASALRDAVLAAGVPAVVANGYEDLFGGMARHLDAGDYSAEPSSPENAGQTSLKDFAQRVLQPAFESHFAATT